MEKVFNKYKSLIVNFFLFVFVVIFFTSVSPIFPWCGDDWYFTGSMRLPWPMWGVFNPIKVLPEILEPLGGYIAAFIVYPLTGDYFASIALTQAIVISVFITLLFWMSFKYFNEKFSLPVSSALCIELIFFSLFFLIFKHKNQNSYYGFWSSDINCYFNYIIPGILNAVVMLFIARSHNFVNLCDRRGGRSEKNRILAILLIGIYLALFSNIQSSIILSGYCFIRLVETAVKSLMENQQVFKVKELWIYGTVDLLWLISLIFESSGLRARGLTEGANGFFIMPVSEAVNQYKELLSYVGKYYIRLFIIFGLLAQFVLFMDGNIRKRFGPSMIRLVLLFVIVMLYLTLIHAKTGGAYGRRPDTMWPAVFLILLLTSIFVVIVFTKLKSLEFCMIPMIFILFLVAFNLNGKFIQFEIDYDIAKKINDSIIEQVITADKTGQSKAVVRVPQGDPNTNWPYPYNMAYWLQNALYSHNIISNRFRIEFKPDPSLNETFLYKKNVEIVPFNDLEQD